MEFNLLMLLWMVPAYLAVGGALTEIVFGVYNPWLKLVLALFWPVLFPFAAGGLTVRLLEEVLRKS